VADHNLVHAPLAHWATNRAHAVAMTDGQHQLTFAQLHAAAQHYADSMNTSHEKKTRNNKKILNKIK